MTACAGRVRILYRCGAKSERSRYPHHETPGQLQSQFSLDQYGRTVPTCAVAAIDLGEWLVSNSLDWPQYSRGGYVACAVGRRSSETRVMAGSSLYRTCVRLDGRPESCSDDANGHP